MPDFFDRLIARGTQPPSGTHQPRGTQPPAGAAVTFARPRLPGPFERPAAGPPDPLLEVVDEITQAREAPHPARPAPQSPPGAQAAITPAPRPHGVATSQAPGSAATAPAERPPVTPAPDRQAAQMPMITQAYQTAEPRTAQPDQASPRAARPANQEQHTPDGIPSSPPRQPSPQRPLTITASAVHAARPAADEARDVQAPPPEPSAVTVRIGRIEVRNTTPDRRERQPEKRARRAAPKLTLAAYLAAANAGQSGQSGPSSGSAR